MSTHNIGFYEDLTKIIFKLSSNAHFSSSSAYFRGWSLGQVGGGLNTVVLEIMSIIFLVSLSLS